MMAPTNASNATSLGMSARTAPREGGTRGKQDSQAGTGRGRVRTGPPHEATSEEMVVEETEMPGLEEEERVGGQQQTETDWWRALLDPCGRGELTRSL